MRSYIIATLFFALSLPAAEAQVTVLGASQARECFLNAQGGRRTSTEPCDAALETEQLSERDRAATFVNRGILHNKARQLDLALADFDAALEINLELAEAYLNRGNTYFFRRQFEEAYDDYSRAIELEVEALHYAYYNRALVLEVLKRYGEAREDLDSALGLEPEFAEAQERIPVVDALMAGTIAPAEDAAPSEEEAQADEMEEDGEAAE